MLSSDYEPRNDGLIATQEDYEYLVYLDDDLDLDISYLADDPDVKYFSYESSADRYQLAYGCYWTKRCKGAE